jgi:hypothetical protein
MEIVVQIQIFVKGLDGKCMTLRVKKSDKLDKLKEMIHDKTEIPVAAQRLIFCGRYLYGNLTLFDYNIYNESTVSFQRSLGTRRPEDDWRLVHPTFDNCPPHPFPPLTR